VSRRQRTDAEREATRIKRSESLREAHRRMSPEARERRRVKLSEAAKRQMRTPEARKRSSENMTRVHARAGGKALFVRTPEITEKIVAPQRGRPKAWIARDPDKFKRACAAIGKKNAKRFARLGRDDHELFQPETRKKALRNSAEEGRTNPRRGRFETNVAAREWHLRSPDGVEYHFWNLRNFIREHAHLFSEEQLCMSAQPPITRAEQNLARLSPRRRDKAVCVLGGWTWIHDAAPVAPAPPELGQRPEVL